MQKAHVLKEEDKYHYSPQLYFFIILNHLLRAIAGPVVFLVRLYLVPRLPTTRSEHNWGQAWLRALYHGDEKLKPIKTPYDDTLK